MRKLALGSGIVVALALVMSACGGNGGSTKGAAGTAAPKSAPSTTPTTAASAPPTTAPTAPTTAPSPGGQPSPGTVPIYQPSSVVSQAAGHTQLTSPDDVAKVTAFYQQALSQDGWGLTSTAKTATSANFVAKRSGMGATVAISTTGPTGTSISVSTYPA
jgi:hypothetical protein